MMFNTKYNNSLHILDLGCNNIGDYGIDHISKWLVRKPALKTLILCRNIITDHGARSLSYSIPFSKLLFLDISYNKITDNGMVDILCTLKKYPMLRHLKIFGNCIGHSSAKIVKRMLLSQVLNQENIDVRPYKVDHRWYFAKYEGDYYEKENNIPYYLSSQMQKLTSLKIPDSIKTCYKYTYSTTSEIKSQHLTVSLISTKLSRNYIKDCRCCYCLKCQASDYDEKCRDIDHPDTCTCCKCKGDKSSEWSIDKSVLKKVVSPPDPAKNIEYIIKQVNSKTRKDILRWININEDILEEDLKLIDPSLTKESTEESISCKCSWMQLSSSLLQKYLQQSSSKNLIIIPKDNFICLKDKCKNFHAKKSSLDDCANTNR
ncbi:uncharacterized protein LOC102675572 isoform X1 [Apis dorsata]|uniref:uncharacterized protein LOC102675572 isoform X1 n=1 Tax=Apis dorsata TaxID=7462 RepID=UPI0003DF5464|nr:uncharacterized protein LOC102675572 isoform X1 [Apis dorsata]